MNKKIVAVASVAVFALFIVISVFLYNRLAAGAKPQAQLTNTPSSQASADTGEESQTSQETPKKTKSPDFTVADKDGNEVKLSSLEGKPVVLNFWASWCPNCTVEMPEFDEVWKEVGDDVHFMMIDSIGGSETKEVGEKYIEDNGYSFPVYYDTKQEAVIAYGIRALPTSVFIDKDGYIVTAAEGAINKEVLLQAIGMISG